MAVTARPGPASSVGGWVVALWLLAAAIGVRAAGSVERQVLVRWRDAAVGGLQLQARSRLPAGARVVERLPLPGWEVVELAEGTRQRDAVAWLRQRPEVVVAEPNHRYRLHLVPRDPEFTRLYGLDQIGAPAAWSATTGSSNVVVAVVDTGVDPTHPDLLPNLWRNPGEIPGNGVDDDGNGWVDDVFGVDVLDGDGDPTDDAGHGTHVAGIIGAVGNNGRGGAGVCWQVRVMAVRVGGADGFGSTTEIVRGFDYLVAMKRRGVPIRVANCSWGGGPPSVALKEAMEAAGAAGILIVCSAGNDGQDNDAIPAYPVGYDIPEIVGVAASTACALPWSVSNFGRSTVGLGAPGVLVLSCYPRGERYALLSGTSMASPHVAGAAALLLARRPDLTTAQLRALLLGSVEREPAWSGVVASGGRLNLGRAMQWLEAGIAPPVTVSEAVPTPITLASPGRSGRWGNGPSGDPALSGDGRWVAFRSSATNLVAGDGEGFDDIFLFDRTSNVVTRVSQTAAGVGGNGDSRSPALSADGRFVAFVSRAANFGPSDANGMDDVYLWDRTTRTIELISVRSDGRGTGGGLSEMPAINADGSVVAFASEAANLVSGDRNATEDVFVRDRGKKTTERISVGPGGVEARGWSDGPSLSADGRLVAFESSAANLVTSDLNQSWDCFVRDRAAGTTERVSTAGSGAAGNADSYYPVLSGDGRWVGFSSLADNLDDAPMNDRLLVFLKDRATGAIIRASGPPDGSVPEGDGYVDALSFDGRWLTFSSDDPRLGPGGLPGFFRVFGFDRGTGGLEELGLNASGYTADDSVVFGRCSDDGRRVAFAAYASNLVPGDGNGQMDVFLLDRGTERPDLSVRGAVGERWIGAGSRHPRVPQRVQQAIDATGGASFQIRLANAGGEQAFRLGLDHASAPGWEARVTEDRTGTNLTESLMAGGWVTPVVKAGSNLLLTVKVRRVASTGEGIFAVRCVARSSAAGDELDAVSVVTSATVSPPGFELASRAEDGAPSDRTAEDSRVSGDGRFVVFSSESDRLMATGDTNFVSDIFLRDRQTGTLRRISDASATDQADADSHNPSLSADGRFVTFDSRAGNLVPADRNQVEDIFVRDLVTGGFRRANTTLAGVEANRVSDSGYLAAGGRFIVFASLADNLVAGDANRVRDLFVKDLQTGAVECASRARSGVFADGESGGGTLSADGRFLIFTSYAGNLIDGDPDTNRFADVYLLDRNTGGIERISANIQGAAGDGPSGGGLISDDGRWVTFYSYATDLVAGAPGNELSWYLLDRSNRTLRPVAEVIGALPGGLSLRRAGISPDGRWLELGGSLPCGLGVVGQALVYDRVRGQTRWVSARRDGVIADGASFTSGFSADGRYLAFESVAANLVGEAASPAGQVYLADLATAAIAEDARREPDGSWRGPVATDGLVPPLVQVLSSGLAADRSFAVRFENAGTHADRWLVTLREVSPASKAGVSVSTGTGSTDITAAVLGAGWLSDPVPAGDRLEIRVRASAVPEVTGDREFLLAAASTVDPAQGRSVRLQVVEDRDGDAIPDAWERDWFGALGAAGRNDDSDGDGATDREEWESGTDPLDPASAVRLRWTGTTPMRVEWKTVGGYYYQLERSGEASGAFEPVTGPPVWGTGQTEVWVDPGGNTPLPSFYRVRVDRP